MNFVFDIGNVLIRFKPKLFLRSLLNDPYLEEKMNDLIFEGAEWKKLDEDTITREEACVAFCKREPAYQDTIEKVMANLTDLLLPIPETIEILPEIKKSDHKLYFLSNYHVKLSQYIMEKYAFFTLFDGGVFSCDVHLLKPSAEIFAYFLDKYRLDAKDCLFFDDVAENVKTAESIGMKGILFHGAQDVKQFLTVRS